MWASNLKGVAEDHSNLTAEKRMGVAMDHGYLTAEKRKGVAEDHSYLTALLSAQIGWWERMKHSIVDGSDAFGTFFDVEAWSNFVAVAFFARAQHPV